MKTLLSTLGAITFIVVIYAQEKLPKYGNDSVTCVQNLSLYREYAKQKNYKDAISSWRYVFYNCPRASKNIFIDGIKIMKFKYKESKDKKYIDTLMMIYDKRIENFGQEGYVLGRKGTSMLKYQWGDITEIYNTLKRSFELQGDKSEAGALVAYMQASVLAQKKGILKEEDIVNIFENIINVIEKNKNDNERGKYYEKALAAVENIASPYLNCNVLINIFSAKYEENQENLNWLKRALKLLNQKECVDAPLYSKIAEKFYSLEPSADAAFNLGILFLTQKNYKKAIDYLNDALKQENDSDKKEKILINMAKGYLALHRFSEVRSTAYKILELNPKNGTAYILIGDAYALSSNSCGTNEFEKKAVFWVAIDKFIKAKEVDKSVSQEANKKISTYSQHFPDKETAFFYNVKEGDKYTVGCWINESTIARFK